MASQVKMAKISTSAPENANPGFCVPTHNSPKLLAGLSSNLIGHAFTFLDAGSLLSAERASTLFAYNLKLWANKARSLELGASFVLSQSSLFSVRELPNKPLFPQLTALKIHLMATPFLSKLDKFQRMLEKISRHCPQIVRLSISGELPASCVLLQTDICRQLQRLEVHPDGFEPRHAHVYNSGLLEQWCPQLQELCFTVHDDASLKSLLTMFPPGRTFHPLLTELRVYGISTNGIQSIARYCLEKGNRLTKLALNFGKGSSWLSDADLGELAKCKQLTHLTLQCDAASPIFLKASVEQTTAKLIKLLESLTELTHLTLDGHPFVLSMNLGGHPPAIDMKTLRKQLQVTHPKLELDLRSLELKQLLNSAFEALL